MSFFARKRQRATIAKKKAWELSSDEDEDELNQNTTDQHGSQDAGDEAGEGLGFGEGEMICKSCNGERDADLFCLDCKLYYCVECFADSHKYTAAPMKTTDNNKDKPDTKNATDSTAANGNGDSNAGSAAGGDAGSSGDNSKKTSENKVTEEAEQKHLHKLRALVGGKSLDVLTVGWIVGESKSQRQKKEDRDEKKRYMEAEEKAKKEKQKQLEEAKAAQTRKAAAEAATAKLKEKLAAATAAAAAASTSSGQMPGAVGGVPGGVIPGGIPAPKVPSSKRYIFVSNIPFNAKVSDVRNLFKQCGRIVELNMPQNRKRPVNPNYPPPHMMPPHMQQQMMMQQCVHKGIAFIEYDSPKGAEAALKMDGQLLMYRPIKVAMDQLGPHRTLARPAGVPYKTKMCIYFEQGKCFRGESCTFAHHPREIQKGVFIKKPPPLEGSSVDGGFKWSNN
eukprot:CAMPEP_0197517180 /NCGR_PEP_ID=MMETSP1318-20131121/2152_1 /TAXON_ID=552666 /ORGANISM="Partenskyella glossopodia, Strain RCC365" /LENGTH=448 /DNA_ID=CAMNT_0043066527 /DNA_START=62 /DNA_END=1408 /DNA_ORIENTATION=-